MSGKVKVAIAGIGNCASSLVQGVSFYSDPNHSGGVEGLMSPSIGHYRPEDIEFVAAFDIDARKVGKKLSEAIFQKPNCTLVFCKELKLTNDPEVMPGPILDGFAEHLKDYPVEDRFLPLLDQPPVDVVQVLKDSGAQVLVSYMPVGSQEATEFYAQCALDAGCAFVNAIPVFISSDPVWAQKFTEAGLPIIGDDIKSQVGATIVHRVLTKLFNDRGYKINRTYQLNFGGNTDFLNMKRESRLTSKRKSKTQAVTSQLSHHMAPENVYVGPSDYVRWLQDNKMCHIRIEGTGFGGAPIELELKLSVIDSPNSAGVVIDAVRYAKLALDRGLGGPLYDVSAYLMKSPPSQMYDPVAAERCREFARLQDGE